ncbi:MAG TPA: peroxiredoxin [Candidatus Limnocylindrales bacterium]|nr:peroxiredoxin [Candidatus Limnocylindrales bacterium]
MAGRPYARRLNELEERFRGLAPELPEGPAKEAFSVLHGMIQELWRSIGAAPAPGDGRRSLTLEDIANLYKTAPAMSGEAENEPLPVGTPAPDFTLPDSNGEPVSLSEFRGSPVVLVFYPLDWSPTCSDQLSLYQAELPEFERYGARILGVSVDSIYSHGAWAAVRGLEFPLLADFEPKGEVARRYHVYRTRDGFSERALFVIDAQGTIRYAHVSPRLDRIPDIYELYGALSEVTGLPVPATTGRSAEPEEAAGEPVAAGAAREG